MCGKAVLVGEADQHGVPGVARARAVAFARELLVAQVSALVARERDVHGVHRGERREHRLARIDEVARLHHGLAGAALEGRPDVGEAEVELRALGVGARGEHVGFGLLRLHPALVKLALRDRAFPDQLLGALQLLVGERDACLGALCVRVRRGGRRLVFAAVDREEQLPLLDHAALLVVDPVQVARDPRPDLGPLDRLDVAAVLVPLGDRLLNDRGDVDVRRRHLLLIPAAAGGEQSRRDSYPLAHGSGFLRDFPLDFHGAPLAREFLHQGDETRACGSRHRIHLKQLLPHQSLGREVHQM